MQKKRTIENKKKSPVLLEMRKNAIEVDNVTVVTEVRAGIHLY